MEMGDRKRSVPTCCLFNANGQTRVFAEHKLNCRTLLVRLRRAATNAPRSS